MGTCLLRHLPVRLQTTTRIQTLLLAIVAAVVAVAVAHIIHAVAAAAGGTALVAVVLAAGIAAVPAGIVIVLDRTVDLDLDPVDTTDPALVRAHDVARPLCASYLYHRGAIGLSQGLLTVRCTLRPEAVAAIDHTRDLCPPSLPAHFPAHTLLILGRGWMIGGNLLIPGVIRTAPEESPRRILDTKR